MGNDLLSFKKWIFRDGQQVRGNAHRDKRWTLIKTLTGVISAN
jgi:hypothetical protein